MSLGSSDMAGGALGTAFSLLLLASIIQGRPDLEVLHEEKVEAAVGEDVVLPCTVKSSDTHILSIEWSKNRHSKEKLIVYNPSYGLYSFWPNVTVQVDTKTMSSSLHLRGVNTWDGGIYTCELATFPLGFVTRETELSIKDLKIACDADDAVEVLAGGNVTITCSGQPDAQHRWTKNGELVSERESLELWWVTDAHAGVYTLTVEAGSARLHKEFNISVLTATTGWSTDLTTESPQSDITEDGRIRPEDATSLTTAFDANASWGTSTDTRSDSTKPGVTISGEDREASAPDELRINSTSSADPHYFNSSKDAETEPTHAYDTSTPTDQWASSDRPTTLRYGSPEIRPTQETGNESLLQTEEPDVGSSTNPEGSGTLRNTTEHSDAETHTTTRVTDLKGPEDKEESEGTQSVLLVLIILPMLVLIAVAGYLCRKRVIKYRMDQPPPFKPPPPPVKYTSAVRSPDVPISRCNSLTETDVESLKSALAPHFA